MMDQETKEAFGMIVWIATLVIALLVGILLGIGVAHVF